jgi:hypothetical protein
LKKHTAQFSGAEDSSSFFGPFRGHSNLFLQALVNSRLYHFGGWREMISSDLGWLANLSSFADEQDCALRKTVVH